MDQATLARPAPLISSQVGADLYRSVQAIRQDEHEALSSIRPHIQSPADFAVSALVNVGSCTLDDLKRLICEVARIARSTGCDADVDPSTMEPVLEALDSAHDLVDEVHVSGGVCPRCSGSGEGRFGESSRCTECGGTGGAR